MVCCLSARGAAVGSSCAQEDNGCEARRCGRNTGTAAVKRGQTPTTLGSPHAGVGSPASLPTAPAPPASLPRRGSSGDEDETRAGLNEFMGSLRRGARRLLPSETRSGLIVPARRDHGFPLLPLFASRALR